MAKGTKTAVRKGASSSRKAVRSWSTYVHRALKEIDDNATISSKSMKVVNSFVSDMFERIAVEAATLVRASGKKTLGTAEIQTAVRLVLPAELARHAMSEGTKATKACVV